MKEKMRAFLQMELSLCMMGRVAWFCPPKSLSKGKWGERAQVLL